MYYIIKNLTKYKQDKAVTFRHLCILSKKNIDLLIHHSSLLLGMKEIWTFEINPFNSLYHIRSVTGFLSKEFKIKSETFSNVSFVLKWFSSKPEDTIYSLSSKRNCEYFKTFQGYNSEMLNSQVFKYFEGKNVLFRWEK